LIPTNKTKNIVSNNTKSSIINNNSNVSVNTNKNETINNPSIDNSLKHENQPVSNDLNKISNADEKKIIVDEKRNNITDNKSNNLRNDNKNVTAIKTDEAIITQVLIEENQSSEIKQQTLRNPDYLTPIITDNSTIFKIDDLNTLNSVPNQTEYYNVGNIGGQNNSVINNQSRFSISAFYSPNSTKNHLTANSANGSDEVTEYKNREKPVYTFSTGLSLRYDLNNKWSISSGCNYSTLAYSMFFSTIYVKYGSDNELHYQYPTSCGTIEMPNNYSQILHLGDSLNVNMNCSQVLRFISIPLVARYDFIHSRLSVYADAGLSLNFMIQEQVKLNYSSTEKIINNNIDGLKNVNYGYLFGAGLQYNFDNKFGIFMEPSFKGSINSLTKNSDVNCYPYSFGLMTGVTFHF
jgi:opacity protein-like surface antigen